MPTTISNVAFDEKSGCILFEAIAKKFPKKNFYCSISASAFENLKHGNLRNNPELFLELFYQQKHEVLHAAEEAIESAVARGVEHVSKKTSDPLRVYLG